MSTFIIDTIHKWELLSLIQYTSENFYHWYNTQVRTFIIDIRDTFPSNHHTPYAEHKHFSQVPVGLIDFFSSLGQCARCASQKCQISTYRTPVTVLTFIINISKIVPSFGLLVSFGGICLIFLLKQLCWLGACLNYFLPKKKSFILSLGDDY